MNPKFDRGTRFGELYDALARIDPPRTVSREVEITDSRFENFFASISTPFIMTSAPRNLPTCDYIAEIKRLYSDLVVNVRHGDYINPENYAPDRRQLAEMTLGHYLDLVAHEVSIQVPPYAGNFTLPRDFLDNIGAKSPRFYPAEIFEPPTVWLGAAGCITPLHRDSTDNFAVHLLGRKRWTIFPPQDAPYLYLSNVAASKGGDFATSAVDLRRPDLQKYPLFSKSKGLTFEVQGGEILYLPMGWSHYVENLSTSLMVNYWLAVRPLGIAALAKR